MTPVPMRARIPWAKNPVVAIALAFGLALAACGGSSSVESATPAGDGVSTPAEPNVEDVAAENSATLTTSDDPLDTEVLSVVDGTVASLRDTVTGDRPVLLWFWAPH